MMGDYATLVLALRWLSAGLGFGLVAGYGLAWLILSSSSSTTRER